MFQNPEKESKKMPLSETEIYKNQHQSEEGYHSLTASQISQNSSRNRVASQFIQDLRTCPKTLSGQHQFKCN